jgi:hypothetical protein
MVDAAVVVKKFRRLQPRVPVPSFFSFTGLASDMFSPHYRQLRRVRIPTPAANQLTSNVSRVSGVPVEIAFSYVAELSVVIFR